MSDTFTLLSAFARSWGLVGMTVFFALAVLWTFRPGSRPTHDALARSILRDDRLPPSGPSAPGEGSQHRQEA